MNAPIDPGHEQKRGCLNLAGILLLVGGIPCALTGLIMFASSFGRFPSPMESGPPPGFLAVGMIGIGGICSITGLNLLRSANRGKIMRYQAGEIMPVARDVARNIAPAVGDVVREIKGATDTSKRQHGCGTWNDADDKYCKGCGKPVARPTCGSCGAVNDADAGYCDKCGEQF